MIFILFLFLGTLLLVLGLGFWWAIWSVFSPNGDEAAKRRQEGRP